MAEIIINLIAGQHRKKKKGGSCGSSSSIISSAEIKGMIDRLKMQRFRDSTWDTYLRVWKIFNKFFVRLDHKRDQWEDHIVSFAGYLIDQKLKSSTMRSYISALRAVLAEDNIKLNEDYFTLSSLI